ncbi:MAG: hypothetical protein EXQ96_09200 [Alphaproteobacteria bacterium]|nr:hypothetical protein [Alphaproteobacteria bacterium]
MKGTPVDRSGGEPASEREGTATPPPERVAASAPPASRAVPWGVRIALAVGAVALLSLALVSLRDRLPGFLGDAGGRVATLIGVAAVDPRATLSALQIGMLTARMESTERDLRQLRDAPRPAAGDAKAQALAGEAAEAAARATAAAAALAARVAEVEQRLAGSERSAGTVPAALEARLAAIEAASASAGPSAAGIERLAARVGALESVAAALPALAARIEALEARPVPFGDPAARARGAGLLAALAGLRPRLVTGAAYGEALKSLQAAVGDDAELTPALKILTAQGAAGVPTLVALRERLQQTAPAILKAAAPPAEGWAGQTLQRLASVITIRRLDAPAEGDDTESLVVRAEQALAHGNVGAAIAAIERLPDPARPVAAAWLGDARARQGAEAALAAVEARAITLVIDAGRAGR